jgi:hypothetical protein
MPKPIPTIGQPNWGAPLNEHLSQLQNPTTGSINSFSQFNQRPTNLTAQDDGKTYLFTQTGNMHRWTGTTWEVLNQSVINVKDYGAVGDGVVDDYQAIQSVLDSVPSGSVTNAGLTSYVSIYFPRGIYMTSRQLTLTNRRLVALFGDSKWTSILTGLPGFNTSLGKSIFKIRGGNHHFITRMMFNGRELGASGLEIETEFNTDIIDVAAFSHHQGGGTDPLGGIHIYSGKHIRIKDCNLHNSLGYGILFMNKSAANATSALDDVIIDSCAFDEQPCGIYIASFCTGPFIIKDCNFASMSSQYGNGEQFGNYCIAINAPVWDISIAGCKFKNADYGIKFVTIPEMQNLQIKNNIFQGIKKFSVCQSGSTSWKHGSISGNTFILGKLTTTTSNQAVPVANTSPESANYSCAIYMVASWVPALVITENIFEDEDNLTRYQVVIQPNDVVLTPKNSIIKDNVFLGNQSQGIYYGASNILGKLPNRNTNALVTHASDAAAGTAGLVSGDLYTDGAGVVRVKL